MHFRRIKSNQRKAIQLRISPSHAHVWAQCSASVSAKKGKTPQSTLDAAKEGTKAHEVAESILTGLKEYPSGDTCVDTYIKYIHELAEGARIVEYEKRVSFLHIGGGYIDCMIIKEDTLHIIDFKSGYTLVSAKNNLQLILYASIAKQYEGVSKIKLHIVQPKINNIDSHEYDIGYIFGVTDRLEAQAKQIREGLSIEKPGRHCKNCKALFQCESAREASYGFYELALENHSSHDLTPVEIGEKLKAFEEMESFLKASTKALRAQVEAYLDSGEYVGAWSYAPGRNLREWDLDERLVEQLLLSAGIEPHKKKLLSPAEAEKQGLDVSNFAVKKPSGKKLEYVKWKE